MFNFLSKISRRINYIMAMISGVLILLVCLFLTADIIARNLFKTSILWVHDISHYFLLCIIFLAAAFAMQDGGHISADFVSARVKKSVKKLFDLLAYLFSIGYIATLIWVTSNLFLNAIRLNSKTSAYVKIPTSWLHGMIILGSVCLLVVIILKIYETLAKREQSTGE